MVEHHVVIEHHDSVWPYYTCGVERIALDILIIVSSIDINEIELRRLNLWEYYFGVARMNIDGGSCRCKPPTVIFQVGLPFEHLFRIHAHDGLYLFKTEQIESMKFFRL